MELVSGVAPPVAPMQGAPSSAPAPAPPPSSPGLERMREQAAIEDAERLLEQLQDADEVADDLSATEYDELQEDVITSLRSMRPVLQAIKMDNGVLAKLEAGLASAKAKSERKPWRCPGPP